MSHDRVYRNGETYDHVDDWGACLCSCGSCRDHQGICICDDCCECNDFPTVPPDAADADRSDRA